jgi:hypothetical protein
MSPHLGPWLSKNYQLELKLLQHTYFLTNALVVNITMVLMCGDIRS